MSAVKRDDKPDAKDGEGTNVWHDLARMEAEVQDPEEGPTMAYNRKAMEKKLGLPKAHLDDDVEIDGPTQVAPRSRKQLITAERTVDQEEEYDTHDEDVDLPSSFKPTKPASLHPVQATESSMTIYVLAALLAVALVALVFLSV